MLTGYEILEVVHRGPAVQVARARRLADGVSVIVKQLPGSARVSEQLARLRLEHRVLAQLAAAGARHCVRPLALVDDAALVLEDIGGQSLAQLTQGQPLPLPQVLAVGLKLACALLDVHRAGVLHRDVNPNNVVVRRDLSAVQLVDFDLASELPRLSVAGESVNALQGTPAYLAPEQTGRTHRSVDSRTDLYSLGTTLYALLCGRPPFQSSERAQLVHDILVRPPPPLSPQVPGGLPEVVEQLVAKLMAKAAEHRYQSAAGVVADLGRCLAALTAEGAVPSFPLAQHESHESFAVPEKLYGRGVELARLEAAYRAVADGGIGLAVVRGASGVGKSALVGELNGQLSERNALLVAGKHDLLRRHVPLDGMRQALDGLVRRVLREPEAELAAWRRRIQQAVGGVGQALIDIAPAFALLLGPQRPIPALGPQETENRLMSLVERLLLAVSTRQPLLLFVDDLQWADSATLTLLRRLALARGWGGALLLVGAYRDNEVAPDHPLAALLRELQGLQIEVTDLPLQPLGVADVQALLVDVTHRDEAGTAPLARLIVDKTGGNAFFVREFLRSLWTSALLRFDAAAAAWTWDTEAIGAAHVTQNVASLLAAALQALPPAPRQLVATAACLGGDFRISMLCAVAHLPRAAVADLLDAPLAAGILVPLEGSDRSARDTAADVGYRFVHDQVQHAAYALLDAAAAEQAHQVIGDSLRAAHAGEPPQAWVFEVVRHLNAAAALRPDVAARADLAELNMVAAQQAKKSAAYGPAMRHLDRVHALVGDDWEGHHALTRAYHVELAECLFLSGQLGPADAALALAEAHAADAQEASEVATRRAVLLMSVGDYPGAVAVGQRGLRALGESPSMHPGLLAVGYAIGRMFVWLGLRRGRRLEALPPMTSAHVLAYLRLLVSLAFAAFLFDDLLFAWGTAYGAYLALRHGQSQYTAAAWMGQVVVTAQLAKYGEARLWSERYHATLAARPDSEQKALMQFGYLVCYQYIFLTLPELGAQLRQLRRACQEDGQPKIEEFATNLASVSTLMLSLRQTHDELLAQRGLAGEAAVMHQAVVRLIERLLGRREQPEDLAALAAALPPLAHSFVAHIGIVHSTIMRDGPAARAALRLGFRAQVLRMAPGVSRAAICTFGCLALLQGAWAQGRVAEPLMLWRMRRQLALLAPLPGSTQGGLVLLVDAERAALAGRDGAAASLYERAIEAIVRAGNVAVAAMAQECAGRFYARRGLRVPAGAHLTRAVQSFEAWGCAPKVRALQAEFAAILLEAGAVGVAHGAVAASGSTTGVLRLQRARHLATVHAEGGPGLAVSADVLPLAEALEAIVHLGAAPDSRAACAAGLAAALNASRAELLLPTPSGDWQRPLAPADAAPALAHEVVNYVVRSGETVSVDDMAEARRRFGGAYWATTQARALLAVAVGPRRQARGVLLLENDTNAAAFAPLQATLGHLLGSQVLQALDLEALREQLEAQLRDRTQGMVAAHERALRQMRQDAEAQMAGGFAHEIRNALGAVQYPMGALGGGEGLIRETLATLQALAADAALPPGARAALVEAAESQGMAVELLDAMGRGLSRAGEVTERIIAYAQAGQLLAGDESAPVADVVAQVLAGMEARLRAADVQVQAQVPPQARLPMRRDHVQQVLEHLVANACDALAASAAGSRRLTISCEAVGPEVALVVDDTGIGLGDAQGRLFQPFYSTKGAHGMGLGLAVSRKLAQVYGGSLDASSHGAAGARFRLALPRAALPQRPDAALPQAPDGPPSR